MLSERLQVEMALALALASSESDFETQARNVVQLRLFRRFRKMQVQTQIQNAEENKKGNICLWLAWIDQVSCSFECRSSQHRLQEVMIVGGLGRSRVIRGRR